MPVPRHFQMGGIWITSQAGVWGVCPLQIEKIRFLHEILIPKQFLASLSPPIIIFFYSNLKSWILGPISITPIVYKNQVSGYGFWTKFHDFLIQCISQQYVFKILRRSSYELLLEK
jgi:hypothetical protein